MITSEAKCSKLFCWVLSTGTSQVVCYDCEGVDIKIRKQEVRAKNPESTQQEVEFHSFTSGGFEDREDGH